MTGNIEGAFYFIRDGRQAARLVCGGRPFPPEVYDEVKPPETPGDTPIDQYNAMRALAEIIMVRGCGVKPGVHALAETAQDGLPRAYLGDARRRAAELAGDMTAYQFALVREGEDLYTVARTDGGFMEAIHAIAAQLAVTENRKTVYLPKEAFHVYDRALPPVRHAFDRFTVSFYGTPYIKADLDDERVFDDVVAFGTDVIPLAAQDIYDAERVRRVKTLIARYAAAGVRTRLYGVFSWKYAYLGSQSEEIAGKMRREARDFVAAYQDADGIAEWGFYEEPEAFDFEYCRIIKDALKAADPKQRPVYIILGPRAHTRGVQSFYNLVQRVIHPDFYCLDIYPFFKTARGDEMAHPYFFAQLELNRNAGVDAAVDTGLILAAIKVGASPRYADINQDFMNFQTRALAAYGCRYIEYFVYYHVHDYCILGENNVPTKRWAIARSATDYLRKVETALFDRRLDAVFHLPNQDGTATLGTTPFRGFRGIACAAGVDAFLSFFEGGVIVVTDKRCSDFDGGDHDVALTGFDRAPLCFNVEKTEWEDIALCPAASFDEGTLTLTLSRAAQILLREA